ncbi:hypothetical protein GRI58_10060 [Porphyrobacter algicida]|uniref:Uncharacterized protein n=2 Tax=Qipengyuania algicida TaxID=1836209 RepID=A0A845AHQ9_9SPHN|nr:hypothetical protein [Qipengyuania algicida]MXP29164.1 hypothetical protein [Qipengyuania algicida]
MGDWVLSLMMLTAVALLGGAAVSWRARKDRKRALLMVVLAAVIVANVVIWTLPGPDGAQSPLQQAGQDQ